MRKLTLVSSRPTGGTSSANQALTAITQGIAEAPKLINDYRQRQRKLRALNALSRWTLEDVGVARAEYIRAMQRKTH